MGIAMFDLFKLSKQTLSAKYWVITKYELKINSVFYKNLIVCILFITFSFKLPTIFLQFLQHKITSKRNRGTRKLEENMVIFRWR